MKNQPTLVLDNISRHLSLFDILNLGSTCKDLFRKTNLLPLIKHLHYLDKSYLYLTPNLFNNIEYDRYYAAHKIITTIGFILLIFIFITTSLGHNLYTLILFLISPILLTNIYNYLTHKIICVHYILLISSMVIDIATNIIVKENYFRYGLGYNVFGHGLYICLACNIILLIKGYYKGPKGGWQKILRASVINNTDKDYFIVKTLIENKSEKCMKFYVELLLWSVRNDNLDFFKLIEPYCGYEYIFIEYCFEISIKYDSVTVFEYLDKSKMSNYLVLEWIQRYKPKRISDFYLS